MGGVGAGVKFGDTTVEFATWEHGRTLIATTDAYTNTLSDFELRAKVRTLQADADEDDYLASARSHVLPWREDEIVYLTAILAETTRRLASLKIVMKLPAKVFFVKTTGWEEGGANGYTRGPVVYLNHASLSRRLIWHELFHVMSRFAAPDELDRIYAVLGFEPVDPFSFDCPTRISNPDAPAVMRHAVRVRHAGGEIKVAIVLMSEGPYLGGSFFRYVRKRLLVLDGSARLLDFGQAQGLWEKLGRNTSYNIHQEEVSAVHFEHLLAGTGALPNGDMVESLGKALSI